MTTDVSSSQKAIVALKRKVASLERDGKFLRSLLLPNQVKVHRAAMRVYRSFKPLGWTRAKQDANPGCNTPTTVLERLAHACSKSSRERAAKEKVK